MNKKDNKNDIRRCYFHKERVLKKFCKKKQCSLPLCDLCEEIHLKDHLNNNTQAQIVDLYAVKIQAVLSLKNKLQEVKEREQQIEQIINKQLLNIKISIIQKSQMPLQTQELSKMLNQIQKGSLKYLINFFSEQNCFKNNYISNLFPQKLFKSINSNVQLYFKSQKLEKLEKNQKIDNKKYQYRYKFDNNQGRKISTTKSQRNQLQNIFNSTKNKNHQKLQSLRKEIRNGKSLSSKYSHSNQKYDLAQLKNNTKNLQLNATQKLKRMNRILQDEHKQNKNYGHYLQLNQTHNIAKNKQIKVNYRQKQSTEEIINRIRQKHQRKHSQCARQCHQHSDYRAVQKPTNSIVREKYQASQHNLFKNNNQQVGRNSIIKSIYTNDRLF